MKNLTTFLCSLAFAFSGVCLAVHETQVSLPSPVMSADANPILDISHLQIPKDLQLDQSKNDTVFIEKHDTLVTNNFPKHVKARVRVKYKTLYVPMLYIATPAEKEDSADSKNYVYQVHKINTDI
jgi:hypothetical protein